MNVTYNKHEKQRTVISNVLLTLILTSNLISYCASRIFVVDNFFPLFIVFVTCLFLIVNFNHLGGIFRVGTLVVIAVFFIQALFGFFQVGNESSRQYFLAFLSVGIPSLLISNQKVDFSVICKTALWINLVTVWYAFEIIRYGYYTYDAMQQMGLSYMYLPILVCSFAIAFHMKKSRLYWALSIVGIITSFGVIVRQMTRGTFICLAFFILIEIMISIKSNAKKVALLITTVLVVMIYFVFIRKYIVETSWYYYMFEVKADDVFNGRINYYKTALTCNNGLELLLGSGVGAFQNAAASATLLYPHNLFLQLFNEQGIFMAFFAAAVIVMGIRQIFDKRHDLQSRQFIVMLLCCAIVKLMISDYYWINPSFWIFLGYVLRGGVADGENTVRDVY